MSEAGTVAAIAGKNFVIVGATRGVSLARYVMLSKRGAKRVFKLDDRILIGYTGIYANFQFLNRLLEYQLKRDTYAHRIKPTVKRVVSVLSSLLYSDKPFSYMLANAGIYLPVEAIVGGFDPDGSGPKLYLVGSIGEVIQEAYAATGSGYEIALAVIEASYRPDITLEEAKRLLTEALKTAAQRAMVNYPYKDPDIEYIVR